MTDAPTTAPATSAADAAQNRADVQKKLGYIGSRLREKSTYAGLTVLISLALPLLSKYVPGLDGDNVGVIVDAISGIGIGIGTLLCIFFPEKTVTGTVVKVLIAAFVLSIFLAGGGPAQAAPLLTGDAKADLARLNANKGGSAPAAAATPFAGLQKFMSDLDNLKKEGVDATVADLNAADADAATLTNPSDPTSFRDPIAHACYPAAVKFLQSLPAAQPLTGTFVVVQLFQRKRDFILQLQAGLPVYLKLGCSPLLGDEAQVFTKMMGLVGIKVALATLVPGVGTIGALGF